MFLIVGQQLGCFRAQCLAVLIAETMQSNEINGFKVKQCKTNLRKTGALQRTLPCAVVLRTQANQCRRHPAAGQWRAVFNQQSTYCPLFS